MRSPLALDDQPELTVRGMMVRRAASMLCARAVAAVSTAEAIGARNRDVCLDAIRVRFVTGQNRRAVHGQIFAMDREPVANIDSHVGPVEMYASDRAVARMLINLTERTKHLDSLLTELDRANQLDAFIEQVDDAGLADTLATLLVNLVDGTDQLDLLMADIAASSHRNEDLIAALGERTNQVDVLVAQLERTIATTLDGPDRS